MASPFASNLCVVYHCAVGHDERQCFEGLFSSHETLEILDEIGGMHAQNASDLQSEGHYESAVDNVQV
jgi:hypothetical protein